MILYVHLEKTQFQVQNTVVFTRHDFQIYLHFHLYSLTIVSTYQYFWVKMHYCTKKNSTENSSVKVKDTNPRDYIVILKSNKNCICSPTTNLSPLLHGQILSLKASKAESPKSHPLPCIETSLKAQLPENWSSLMQSGFRKKKCWYPSSDKPSCCRYSSQVERKPKLTKKPENREYVWFPL